MNAALRKLLVGTILLSPGLGLSLSSSEILRAEDGLALKSERAAAAMKAGRFDEAATLYRGLLRADPANPGLILDLGLALHSAGRYREAVEQFQAYLQREPSRTPVWLLLGVDYRKLGKPQLALQPLERAVEASPADKMARLELAQALLDAGRAREAQDQLAKVTALHPDDAEAWQALGLTYSALARQAFNKLEKIAPDSAYRDVLLARSLVERHQYATAFQLYKQALGKAPQLRVTYEGLAEDYRKMDHADWAAIEEEREHRLPSPDCAVQKLECTFLSGNYQGVVELTRNDQQPEALYWQALAYSELSLEAFGRLSQMPPSAALHDLLAEAYRLQGKYELCVKEWQEAVKLAPRDIRQKEGLAKALWLNHDYQKAEPLLEELVEMHRESTELNYELGDTLLQGDAARGGAQRAIVFLERAARLSPDDKPVCASLGRAYMRAGEPAKAIPQFKAALGLDPEGTLYYQLAEAYQETGQKALAAECRQKFQALSKAAEARHPHSVENYQITPP